MSPMHLCLACLLPGRTEWWSVCWGGSFRWLGISQQHRATGGRLLQTHSLPLLSNCTDEWEPFPIAQLAVAVTDIALNLGRKKGWFLRSISWDQFWVHFFFRNGCLSWWGLRGISSSLDDHLPVSGTGGFPSHFFDFENTSMEYSPLPGTCIGSVPYGNIFRMVSVTTVLWHANWNSYVLGPCENSKAHCGFSNILPWWAALLVRTHLNSVNQVHSHFRTQQVDPFWVGVN